ncbi:MAG TPA: rhomboid family intramembrane serine protease [Gemmataceae bacterium]|nr:rhomboid family intramembrane serine protease [Gemmataceae bacterium]
MLPIGDDTGWNGKVPWVCIGLIVVNLTIYPLQKWVLGQKFTYGYSLVAKEITTGKDLVTPQKYKIRIPYTAENNNPKSKFKHQIKFKYIPVDIPQAPGPKPIYLTLITSMFMHGDWFHVISNMWFLALFGRNVETALGSIRFLIYYLICGICGGLVQVLSDPHSVLPCLGASGAISGVMGAYLVIYPFSKIKVWLSWLVGSIEVPAIGALAFWFLLQYVSGVMAIEYGDLIAGGVAYWDHLGGFLSGFILIVGTIAFLKFKERWKLSLAIAEAAAQEPEQHAPEVVAALERPLSSFALGNFLPPSSQPAASPAAESFCSPALAQSVKPANDSGREESSLLPRRRS